MLDIIRSVFYSSPKKNIIKITYFMSLLIMFIELPVYYVTGTDNSPASAGEFAAQYYTMLGTFAQMFVIINTVMVCCADFADKTANYEIMTGHTRFEIYAARIIVAVIQGVGGFLFMLILPTIAAQIAWGWGESVPFGAMVFRLILMMFPLARIIIEISFVSFIMRNPLGAGIAGFMLSSITGMAAKAGVIFGFTNLSDLMTVDQWMTYGLAGLESVWVTYDMTLPGGYASATILVSLAASAVFFVLGYVFFKHDDIN